MKPRVLLLPALLAMSLGQELPRAPTAGVDPERPRVPGGKSQFEALLKADHARSLEDAGELMKVAEELKIELERNDRHVLSMAAIKKTERIEKLARQIRTRMKRY